MGRINLFEFEDQSWFPSFLRNYGTDFLQFLANATKMYKPIVPILEKMLTNTAENRIVDLGSGGGGSWLWLQQALHETNPELKILLTDYFPNIDAFERTAKKSANFEYISTSIDARDVPAELKGMRTLFLALHHFGPKDAVSILQDAVDNGAPIAIFEGQERSVGSIIGMLLSPISVLLTTPFIRPFRIGRIIFTYLIPIVPLFVLWDGVASSLRTYSVDEMRALVDEVSGHESYHWDIGKVKSGPGAILYLTGHKT